MIRFFLTEHWLYPKIEDSEVFPLICNYSFIARRDRSGEEHGGVLIAAKKDFSFNRSDVTLKSDQTLKVGRISDFAVGISIVSIQSSYKFPLIYNPPLTVPDGIEANNLADLISSCSVIMVIFLPKCFSILGNLNLNDFSSATVTGHNDYSKNLLLHTQQIYLNLVVLEPIYKSGCILDVF